MDCQFLSADSSAHPNPFASHQTASFSASYATQKTISCETMSCALCFDSRTENISEHETKEAKQGS